ncbi:MAG: BspA family leucine-rich repeat surface protein [Bacilli bacterium]|nr:BspA family leucine-rich repeat surface protein [Bacilli bacterium]
MKKLLSFILLLFIPFIVYAESDIHIESIELVNNENSFLESNPARLEGNNIILDLNLYNKGDNLKYKISVVNNTNDEYEFGEIDSNSDYIEYSLDYNNDSKLIAPNSNTIVYLDILYKNEVEPDKIVNGVYNDNKVVTLNIEEKKDSLIEQLLNIDTVKEVVNPNTTSGRIIIAVVLLTISFVVFVVLRKHKVAKYMMLIGGILLMPIIVYAAKKFEFKIEANVKINLVAEFDEGLIVNKKMDLLAGGRENIKSIKRSETLPDNIKTLAEEQLDVIENGISDAEVDELFDYMFANMPNNCLLVDQSRGDNCTFYKYVEQSDDSDYYRFTASTSVIFSVPKDVVNYNLKYYHFFLMKSSQAPSTISSYLIYDAESDGLKEVVDVSEIKSQLKTSLPRMDLSKNILSSPNSRELIYGWYDNNTLYYYSEADNVMLNKDSSYLLSYLYNIVDFSDVENFNLDKVSDINHMFYYTADSVDSFEIDLSNWNLSNVSNMKSLFDSSGAHANSVNVIGLNNWDVSKVTNMSYLFSEMGRFNATIWNIGPLSNWDTSSVVNMKRLFYRSGMNSTSWNVGDLSNWDTSNVVNMYGMFEITGYKTSEFILVGLSNWDVSNVTDMARMFASSGVVATTYSIGNLSNWDTSKVTDMSDMFSGVGSRATSINLGNLSNWDVSNVTDMSNMFRNLGSRSSETFIGNLSKWDTSNVTNMYGMFSYACNSGRCSIQVGSLNVYADNIKNIFTNAQVNIELNILKKPEIFDNAFNYMIGRVVVNYTNEVTNIDDIIATGDGSAIKGNLITT